MSHHEYPELELHNSVTTNRIVVGISQESPDRVAVALGTDGGWVIFEAGPPEARRIAASLLNKADAIEGAI